MSKKDKSKFKKLLKAQISQGLSQTRIQEKTAKMPVSASPPQNISPTPNVKSNISLQSSGEAAISDISNLSQIKYDLKKTAVVIGALVIIMAVLYVLDLKYNILLSFGDVIFRVLHIQ